jgi:hypothetical protein
VQQLIEQQRQQTITEQNMILRSQFKARPIPTSTRRPIYQQLLADEQRRKLAMNDNARRALDKVQPFHLSNNRRIIRRSMSVDQVHELYPQFRAKPAPPMMAPVDSRILNRKGRERSKQLLASAKAPINTTVCAS